ncbi:hypothetical protein PU629_01055 [Pullulanibacillus sp. KACC 23026]|uniref:hypothetical protein n=1 Tax=Pullulanibacillus sp. KACC 23026 TaxID=3028315 RepID=UPI0023B122CF|nr:hypothetical protein [Pullulanibacillus sp. KACC 23026]WEG12976.1 hypothetical protein PU629_01055 [Pullulanibacillus sp. KACC 23026]
MINQLRAAIERQKEDIIKQLIKGEMVAPDDPSICKLTLSELEQLLTHLHVSKQIRG